METLKQFINRKDFIFWLVINEGSVLNDAYGRQWKFQDYNFYFKDINGDFKKGLDCLHLYGAKLYGIDK